MVSGYVLDEHTGLPLQGTHVMIEEAARGVSADSSGFFQFQNLCAGDYHFKFSHIGCEPTLAFFRLRGDTTIFYFLHHHHEMLGEAMIVGDKSSTQMSSGLGKPDISRGSSKNLADLLANVSGVAVIRNGGGVSKPVVHGLYGNRVAILNNGIAQAGQQWGNDHAPEIDPFTADRLTIVKGAAALAYNGANLGSVVLVEMSKLKDDPHLHGDLNYILNSNGWGNTLNLQLSQNSPKLAWRATGTFKMSGDTRTPNHYLTNTGKWEANAALQVEKRVGEKWFLEGYYSMFNTEVGILRGSHVGNLTDLEAAFTRDEPFFTSEDFSYHIYSPRQLVMHHFLKLQAKYIKSSKEVFTYKYGGQVNYRNEYDVRRGGRSNIPALSLLQHTHFVEGNYFYDSENGHSLKAGLQANLVDNYNLPGTGITPLIPGYTSVSSSAFGVYQLKKDRWTAELGVRYDFRYLYAVLTGANSGQVRNKAFSNLSTSVGAKYQAAKGVSIAGNLGYASRSPEVNELYSNGLHQGVSGIEEGVENLNSEHSIKGLLSVDFAIGDKLLMEAVGYYQHINGFIYLQPQSEYRLTIRGAFPVFKYQQTNARIAGLDLTATYEPIEQIRLSGRYSFIHGDNLSEQIPLVFMPPNRVSASVTFSLKELYKLKKNFLTITGGYTFKQDHYKDGQDFLPPPDGVFLLGVSAGTNLQLKSGQLSLSLSVENALNTRYRDYLNRLRYFADEQGLNVVLRGNWSF